MPGGNETVSFEARCRDQLVSSTSEEAFEGNLKRSPALDAARFCISTVSGPIITVVILITILLLYCYYLRADAVPPTPKKRGRRRLTALEVLQAKSLFAGPRRFS